MIFRCSLSILPPPTVPLQLWFDSSVVQFGSNCSSVYPSKVLNWNWTAPELYPNWTNGLVQFGMVLVWFTVQTGLHLNCGIPTVWDTSAEPEEFLNELNETECSCHGTTSPPSFSISLHFQLHLTLSAHLLPPPHQLWNLSAQLCYIHCQTCLDPVPMPRGTIYIPLSNLSDLSSLIIMGNGLVSWLTPFSTLPVCYI